MPTKPFQFLFVMFCALTAVVAQAQSATVSPTVAALAEQQGTVRVIVMLDVPAALASPWSAAQEFTHRNQVATMQDGVLQRLSAVQPLDRASLVRFEITPGFATTVTPQGLEALAQDPAVRSIREDRFDVSHLNESRPIVQAQQSWAYGLWGEGQTVAVLDSGVDKNHPWFGGQVVSEACYSTNASEPGILASSFCPGGATASTASNSGLHCTGVFGCDHGTHVAGIVSGVAPMANLISIQVFTRVDSIAVCGGVQPCVRTLVSNQIQGLERVYALRNQYNIASANMSLGGGQHADFCDGDERKPIIDLLRAAGIATVVSTGNESRLIEVGSPSCISTAVAVGSTTKEDQLSPFSNHSHVVDLLAPGSDILSAIPGGNFDHKDGTSMAAPHVAGAWAALKSFDPTMTVSEIEAVLALTGVSITRPQTPGLLRPRIRMREATALWRALEGLRAVPGDYSGDGRADLVLRNQTTGGLWLYQMNGATAQAGGAVNLFPPNNGNLQLGQDWSVQSQGDFNGMGRMDMLFRHGPTGNLAIGFFSGAYYVYEEGAGPLAPVWQVAGTGDFNGDGQADILARNQNTGQLWIFLMRGGTRIASLNGQGLSLQWRVEAVADFNGDGRADILIRNVNTGQLWIFLMNGATRTASLNAQALALNWSVVGTGDFNGDGRADILIRNVNTGQLWMFLMNGATRAASLNAQALSLDWQIIKLADFNGNGRTDILLRNVNSGQLWMFQMNSNVRSTSSGVTGASIPAGWSMVP